jgi:CHRD domain-containing protein
MNRSRTLVVLTVLGCVTVGAVPAHSATPAQFGQKCRAAWTGAPGSAAFRAYQPKCVAAATSATNAATDTGNPTSAAANRSRSNAACGRRFPTPRNTAAKRLAFASCVSAASASQRSFAGRPLTAILRGSKEVPVAGGASGTATIRLNQGQRRVCFTLIVSGLGGSPVAGAHIHRGGASVAGDVVIPLTNLGPLDLGAPAKGCVQDVDASLIKAIRQNPAGFYVNIHTAQFPGGAARGQLAK